MKYSKATSFILASTMTATAAQSAACPELFEKGVIPLDFNPAFVGIHNNDGEETMTISSFHNVKVNPGGNPPLETVKRDLVARIENIDLFDTNSVTVEELTDLGPSAPKTVFPNQAVHCPAGMFPFEALLIPQGSHIAEAPGRLSVINVDDPNKAEYIIHQSTQLESGFSFPMDRINSPRFYHSAIFLDMDNDGFLDIVTVRSGFRLIPSVYPPFSELVWFRNPADLLDPLTPWEERVLYGGATAGFMGPDLFLAAHDFDGDGIDEIVATHFFTGDKIAIYGAPVGGSWADVNAFDVTAPPVRVADISTDQGKPFTIEIVDLDGDGVVDILATNHQEDGCAYKSDIPGRVFAVSPPSSGDVFSDPWTTHVMMDNIRPQPSMPDAKASRLAPGVARAFHPQRGDEDDSVKRPWILVGGDEAGKVWILKPRAEIFEYDVSVILDINDHYGEGTTQTPQADPFGITISTIGHPAIRYDRDGPTGLAEIFVPVFEARDIHVFGFRQEGGGWWWNREPQVVCPDDITLACPAPATPTVGILVEIKFDRYPQEVGWSIRTSDTNEVIVDVPPGSYPEGKADDAQELDLEPGREYTFRITDTYGDGICCSNGDGQWAIYALSMPDSDLLVQGNGEYGLAEEATFVVPGDFNAEPPDDVAELPPFIVEEIERCGEIIDAHLHLATWFSDAGPMLEEMDKSGVSKGLMYSVYGPTNPFGTDPNDDVSRISLESNGRIVGLASLNTTGVWEETQETELNRLATALSLDHFVGTKLAPPHTCLKLGGDIMRQIVETIADSPSPVLGIHSGTTPFCGPFGDIILGKRGCCEAEYVDPDFLEPLIQGYRQVTFVLLHVGSDFLDEDNDENLPNYNGTLVNKAVALAQQYPNVFLEISAFLRKDETGNYARPLARENLAKIVNAGLAGRVLYGSDANQFPGGMLPYMIAAILAMKEAGFSDEDRCLALEGNFQKLFDDQGSSTTPPPFVTPTLSPAPPATVTPTPPPTPESILPDYCEDTTEHFLADSVAGMQQCPWLQDNMMRYGYLCQFLDVALACPETCDHCELFGK